MRRISLLALLIALITMGCTDGSITVNNAPPGATIELPAVGTTAEVGTEVRFRGVVSDAGTDPQDLRVSWTSSLAGDLWTGAPDADGVTEFTLDDLALGEHTIVLLVTDGAGGSGTAQRLVTVAEVANIAPGAPRIALDPPIPTTLEDLTVVLTEAVDPDDGPEPLTYEYTWSRNGAAVPELDGETTIPAAQTVTGDEWTVAVTAFDGLSSGPAAGASATVVCAAGGGETADCPGVTCLTVLQAGLSTGDGAYWLDPNATGTPFELDCDMTSDGGGWTGVGFVDADTHLAGVLAQEEGAQISGVDPVSGPFTQDEAGDHTAHYTFDFAAGYDAFYLAAWEVKAYAAPGFTSDLNPAWQQSDWAVADSCDDLVLGCGYGDVSFGDPAAAGPIASYGREVTEISMCLDCVLAYPASDRVEELPAGATGFRVGWGEGGGQFEGWYPWWSGAVYLR